MDSSEQVLYIFITLLFSAFFSGLEIAFVSANRFKIELDKKQGNLSGRINSFFASRPASFISTLVIGNNIALVIYGLLFARMLQEPLKNLLIREFNFSSDITVTFLQLLLSTFLILVTGEYIPKNLFRLNPNRSLNIFSIPAFISYWLLYPIASFTVFFSESILKVTGYKKGADNPVFSRMDLDNLIKETTDNPTNAGEDIDHELFILKNALEFVHTRVRDCMVPRNEIEALEVSSDIETLRLKFVETGLSKILVYEDNIDNIIGYVHSFAIFKHPKDIRSMMITPLIVPESMPVKEVLNQFTGRRKSMAVVVDEFGGTAGILTIEDVMEEIFGEIEDEHDSEDLMETVVSENEFIFSGRHEIRYLNEKYKLFIPETDDYTTLAGFIIQSHESLPEEGEIITISPFEIEIIRRDGGKIDEVKLRKRDE